MRAYNRALTASEVSALPVVVSGEGSEFNWLLADQLGTPRMIFDKTGSLATTKRHDYLPFGEELLAGVGGRTTALGYTGDTLRQQFTQKERDNETGLDYFGARYFSHTQGRFVSTDPAGGDPLKPQSFNKYQYAQNNPLCKVDRTGAYEEDVYRDLTTILAYAVGFTWDEAVQIGNENQKVDEDQRDPVQIDLDGPGYEARRDFHFTTPARRADLWHTFEVDARGSHPGLGQYRWSTCEKAFYGAYARGAGLGFIPNGQQGRGYPLVNGQLPVANWLGDAQDRQGLTDR